MLRAIPYITSVPLIYLVLCFCFTLFLFFFKRILRHARANWYRSCYALEYFAGNDKNDRDDLFFEGNKTVLRFSDYTLVGIIRCLSVHANHKIM